MNLSLIRSPAQLILASFSALIVLGMLLLTLPLSSDTSAGLAFEDALFLSTSATTVTGLSTIDIAELSVFGELVVLGLIQVGGFGIMTIGSVIALVAFRHVGLRQRKLAQAEIGAVDFGELSRLLWAIARITLVVEGTLAAVLFVRFWQNDVEDGVGASLYSAVFHSIATFNNAGISLYSDSMARFVGDPFVTLPVTFGFIIGGLGFPVMVEAARRLRQERRRRNHRDEYLARAAPWSLHLRLTIAATLVLLVIGPVMVLTFEWTNPETLGALSLGDKLNASWFHGVTPRTAGFNTIDVGSMNEPTLFGTSVLMFIGSGPASTSGGIKVTTVAVLIAVLWAEVRSTPDVNVFRRRIPESMIRQALTITVLSLAFVVVTSLALTATDGLTLSSALFEATSAFGTVGLSTGVTGGIGTFGHLLLVLVMLVGRVGPITFVAAIALRSRERLYRHPEERPIIG